MSDSQRYTQVALQLLPIGCRRPVITTLRIQIADALAAEAKRVRQLRKEEFFPELAEDRKQLAHQTQALEVRLATGRKELEERLSAARAELAFRQAEAESMVETAQAQVQAAQQERDEMGRVLAGCLGVMDALEEYIGWLDGHGEVLEQRQRWEAVRRAHEEYRSLKSSERRAL